MKNAIMKNTAVQSSVMNDAVTKHTLIKPRLHLLLLLLALLLLAQAAWAQGVSVHGVVSDAAGQPVPGIVVSLFHPANGRSAPAYSDGQGRYILYAVPPLQAPYYIEAYWGERLIYRAPIQVQEEREWHIRLD
ncbi:MAG: carboxypeptidase-like regulatory domain-containing protein [Gammaproteobacteria bacterium]|nr:carboxypeptidase-like regulatory domain-containing protein [Gammaproteobacteria bacterium]